MFTARVPIRRARSHRTHGEESGIRAARDHAALRSLPPSPYVAADRHPRHVRSGNDCLVAFDSNLYSVPARRIRRQQPVETRASAATVTLHTALPPGPMSDAAPLSVNDQLVCTPSLHHPTARPPS